jgi:preprotein translocase subunit SecG
MITFLLVVHAIIAALLVAVILMQKSEGGGLGMGGGPAGLMTARGAADFLTRATSVLATLFVIMAFVIAALASRRDGATKIDANAATQGPIGPITAPGQTGSPLPGIPMAGQPTAPAPDAATQQALQPAAAGLPAGPNPPQPTAQQQADKLHAQAEALRKAGPAPEIRKIDTTKADKAIGSIGNISIANKPATSTPAPAATPTPAAPKPAIPTLNIPAPASNGATPQ